MRQYSGSDTDSPDGGNHRKFLVEHELAQRWNKSRRTVQRMRSRGIGPAYHRIGGSILYRIEDIEAFENTCRIAGAE